ncbi:hypothetical protein IAT40_004220 [Kwoniella sp. CBS 6097]
MKQLGHFCKRTLNGWSDIIDKVVNPGDDHRSPTDLSSHSNPSLSIDGPRASRMSTTPQSSTAPPNWEEKMSSVIEHIDYLDIAPDDQVTLQMTEWCQRVQREKRFVEPVEGEKQVTASHMRHIERRLSTELGNETDELVSDIRSVREALYPSESVTVPSGIHGASPFSSQLPVPSTRESIPTPSPQPMDASEIRAPYTQSRGMHSSTPATQASSSKDASSTPDWAHAHIKMLEEVVGREDAEGDVEELEFSPVDLIGELRAGRLSQEEADTKAALVVTLYQSRSAAEERNAVSASSSEK